jgi:hypothetical protein
VTEDIDIGGDVRVTVQRSATDWRGDETYTDHHVIEGCLEVPSFSTTGRISTRAERDGVLTDSRTIYVPYKSDVLATDRVVIHPDGMLVLPPADTPEGIEIRRVNGYQVLGRPMDWSDPLSGWQPGTEVALMKVS